MATSKEMTLIQCTDSKRDTASKARDLYDESRYFRKMRAWAEWRGVPWFILSAKHGLVHPEQILFTYDERGLSTTQAHNIASKLRAVDTCTVHICAGMDYTDHLIPALECRGVDVVNHFAGERIGTREKLLVEAVE